MPRDVKSFRAEEPVAESIDLVMKQFGGSFSQHANAALADYARRLLGGEIVPAVAIVRKVVLERARPGINPAGGNPNKKIIRWTERRKEAVLAVLHAGLLDREELTSRFGISEELLEEWELESNKEKGPDVID